MTADIDGEFVVVLMGMRINKPWKVAWGRLASIGGARDSARRLITATTAASV